MSGKPAAGYYTGIALISSATLLLELSLLRLFAVQQFYHFAFMAISLALLGAGASGSILSLRRRRMAAVPLCLAFSLSVLAAYLTINYLPFDSFSIAWDRRQGLYLAIYFLAAAVPFLFSGLLIGGELMSHSDGGGSHRVYGANLIGSALGSLGSLVFLTFLGGEGTVVVTVILGAAAGLLLAGKNVADSAPRHLFATIASFTILVVGLLLLWRPPDWLAPRLSPYKTLSILTQALDTRLVHTDWDATARVDVVESSAIHSMPGLSLVSPVGVPVQAGLLLDGDGLQPITGLAPDAPEAAVLADHVPLGLAYRLRPGGRTLVLEAGTGMDVLMALAAGAEAVTVVEENGLVIEIVRDRFAGFSSNLMADPRVTIVNQSGRVFARRTAGSGQDRYAVVTVALTDPHRPVTSGAYSLTEDYVYTVEGLGDYYRLIQPDGLLLITRWLQTPPSESARLFGTAVAALDADQQEPSQQIVAFRTLRTMTLVIGARPFSSAELATVRSFLEQRGYDAVYLPDITHEDLNRFNVLPEPLYHRLFNAILADAPAAYANYRFDIRPPTDNRPFFFHYFKWRQTPEILATLGRTWQPFGGSGYFVLVALLILVGLAAVFFIIGPLLIRRAQRRQAVGVSHWRLRVFAYFAALGLAFLFVELPLAQRFILVLGQPVTALSVIIFAVLLFSGLGSLSVRRWRLTQGLALLVVLIVLYPLLLNPVTALALRGPEWMRIPLTVLTLAPLGYFMGLPFAGGLQVVERVDRALVPWAWAINGSFSVISAVLSVMLALTWGFAAVLWLGAGAYCLALLAFYGAGKWSVPDPPTVHRGSGGQN